MGGPRIGFAIALVLILLVPAAPARSANVRVSSAGTVDPEEVTITIDPTQPLRLAAGANIDYRYHSFDGGLHWFEGTLVSTLGVAGDPVVHYDPDGVLYFAHLSYPAGGSWLDRIVVQRALDGGVTWSNGAGVGLNPPKDQDKPWITSDATLSPHRGNVYLAWTEFDGYGSASPADSTRVLFSRSVDAGIGWSVPVRVSDAGGNCIDEDDTVEGAIPAVGPDGEVYLAWSGPGGIRFDRSLDGGATFGSDQFVATQPGRWWGAKRNRASTTSSGTSVGARPVSTSVASRRVASPRRASSSSFVRSGSRSPCGRRSFRSG